jgi:hypothetical protein
MSVELAELTEALEAEKEKLELSPNIEHHVPQVTYITKVFEVVNTDYALALSTGPQLSATSLRSLQLFMILLVPSMGSLLYGFDGSGRSNRFE